MTGSESGPGDEERGGSQSSRLVPGAMIGAGRYRLLAPHGGANGFRFWRAFDSTLERDVALTVVPAGSDQASVMERTLRLGHIDSPGLARILDVTHTSAAGGIVVAEWTPGLSLREIAETSSARSAHAIRELAAAAETAHRGQAALSIDHPDRIRISSAGNAVLAFPAVPAGAGPDADVEGVGAVLYVLLTGTWPLRGPTTPPDKTHEGDIETIGGLPVAPRDTSGVPLAPHVLRPEVEYPISLLAMRALDTGKNGLRTAGTVVDVIDQNVSLQSTPGAAASTAAASTAAASTASGAEAEASPDRSKLRIYALVGAAALVVVLLVWGLSSVIAGGDLKTNVPEVSNPPVSGTTSSSVPAAPPPAAASSTTPPRSSSPEPTTPPEPASPPPVQQSPVAPAPPVVPPPPPPAPAPAPAPSDVLPCYPGYHHEPPPDGPCLPDGGPPAPAPAPAPAPPPPPPAPADPNQLPCYPGYFHDPAHGGRCWAY